MSQRTIIIVPCFNEEGRLDKDVFIKFGKKNSIELIFINDGSTDNTSEILEEICMNQPKKYSVHHLNKNCGKAEAVRQGFLLGFRSDPTYIGFWDADLSTPLTEIHAFLDIFERSKNVTVALGSRIKLSGRTIERKMIRHYFGRIFATLVATIFKLDIYDTQCGAKIFRMSKILEKAFNEPFLTKWLFDIEILMRLLDQEKKFTANEIVHEIPVLKWKDVPGSKLNLKDLLMLPFDLWKIYLYQNNKYKNAVDSRT